MSVPVTFDSLFFEKGVRLNVLVNDTVICEIKSAEAIIPLWEVQLLSYLKLTGKRLGYLINLNEVLIKNGNKRMVLLSNLTLLLWLRTILFGVREVFMCLWARYQR